MGRGPASTSRWQDVSGTEETRPIRIGVSVVPFKGFVLVPHSVATAPSTAGQLVRCPTTRCRMRSVRLTAVACAIIFALSAPRTACAQTGDPKGWSKARWGMTEQQVDQAFASESMRPRQMTVAERQDQQLLVDRGGKKVPDPFSQPLLQIDSLQLLPETDLEFKVVFTFNRATVPTLLQVSISLVLARLGSCMSTGNLLKARLLERYGHPLSEDNQLFSHSTDWRFAGTMISLLNIGSDATDICLLDLGYRMNQKGNL
jgi:hypothetical protein